MLLKLFRSSFLVVLSIVNFSAVANSSAIEVYDFETVAQEKQFKELSNILRCPKCQNNTIADSNAPLAQDLRQKVFEMTQQGQSKQEIVDYMVARYGNFVTYQPPLTFATLALWLGPIFIIVLGSGLMVARARTQSSQEPNTLSAEDEQRVKSLLNNQGEQEV